MYRNFGEIVKEYREKNGLSMADFAQQAGVSKAYIGVLERGENYETGKAIVPSVKTLAKLASAMGTTLSALLESAPNSSIATTEREEPTADVDDGLSEKERKVIQFVRQLSDEQVDGLLALLESRQPRDQQENR